MPVDFDPQIGEGDEYEVDEEIDDHAKQAHMESKQYVYFFFFWKNRLKASILAFSAKLYIYLFYNRARLSQLGFAPIDALEDQVSGMHGWAIGYGKLTDDRSELTTNMSFACHPSPPTMYSSSRPKLQPQSPIPEPERPLVQVTLAQLAARSGADVDQFRRENKTPAQKWGVVFGCFRLSSLATWLNIYFFRVSEAGVVVPNLPKALIKDLFSSFSRTKVSREALETVMEAWVDVYSLAMMNADLFNQPATIDWFLFYLFVNLQIAPIFCASLWGFIGVCRSCWTDNDSRNGCGVFDAKVGGGGGGGAQILQGLSPIWLTYLEITNIGKDYWMKRSLWNPSHTSFYLVNYGMKSVYLLLQIINYILIGKLLNNS